MTSRPGGEASGPTRRTLRSPLRPKVLLGAAAILAALAHQPIVRGLTTEASVDATPLDGRAAVAGARPPREMETRCADRGGPFLPSGRYALFVVPGLDPLGVAAIQARVCEACADDAGLCRDGCAAQKARRGYGCVMVSCNGTRNAQATARIWMR